MSYKKDAWVICINSEGWNHPEFELQEGKLYLVQDVKASPSLFKGANVKLIFLADDGETKVEINARRFKKVER